MQSAPVWRPNHLRPRNRSDQSQQATSQPRVPGRPSEAQEGKRQKTGLNVSSLVGANPRAP
eukprot:4730326-Pyramimonas_sp.AAC.1